MTLARAVGRLSKAEKAIEQARRSEDSGAAAVALAIVYFEAKGPAQNNLSAWYFNFIVTRWTG